MPEGPEVTIITKNLDYETLGATLVGVEVLSGRYLNNPIDFSKTINKKITSIKNKGKFIFWQFEDDTVLFNTLGMSGTWSKKIQSHSRVRFILDKNLDLLYNDVRNFGTLKVTDQSELNKKLKEIGPDMLNEPCSLIEFKKIIERFPNKNLATFLLDQKRISGVGNIYKAEICYDSCLNPSRTLSSLQDSEISNLYNSILKILKLALNLKGSSQKDFKDINGEHGTFLSDHSNVYRRSTDRLGNPILQAALGDGRNTWWCPNVQK